MGSPRQHDHFAVLSAERTLRGNRAARYGLSMTRGRSSGTVNPFGVIRRAFGLLWGRDVMLYTGGVSFYAMLAGAPGLAILVSIYSLLSTPQVAARQAENLALLLPDSGHQLFAAVAHRRTAAGPRPFDAGLRPGPGSDRDQRLRGSPRGEGPH